MKLVQKKEIIIAFVWVVFISLNLLSSYLERGKISSFVLILFAIVILLFYINYIILVPRFLLKKKLKVYLVSIFILIVVPTLIFELFLKDAVFDPPRIFKPEFLNNRPIRVGFRFIMFPLILNTAVVVFGTVISIYSEWIKNDRNKKEIEMQKSNAQINFLKNQLSPHFLFNSLNSIYSLTNKKSSDAPEAVITLSELMRYMLYQADGDFVCLKDELEYVQNYLKLQRLRILNNENVTLNIHGNVNQQKIRPLLLISFIENAFKYGTDFKGNTYVKIEIFVDDLEFKFSCVNSVGSRNESYENSGIGLKNTKERLELLYPENHSLMISEVNNEFNINLILKLE
ncbi:hypothetical protein A9Q86_09425 [Flavobacteriales bacterium 33_180_T64]|nr:hypothetical protein A9Q86_09425 [Flavobacteriales bacterium 33_180_T64]